VTANVEIALPAVGAHLETAGDMVEHEGGQHRLGDAPHAYAPGRLTAIFDGDHHDRLAADAMARRARPARTEIAPVDLDRAAEELASWDHHRPAQLVKPRPRGLVAAEPNTRRSPSAETPCFWSTRYQTAANLAHQRRPGAGEDRARRDRGLRATGRAATEPVAIRHQPPPAVPQKRQAKPAPQRRRSK
jgi:hypothetical protein